MGGGAFDGFLRWVLDQELAGRPDRARIVSDLETAVSRVLDRAGRLAGRRALDLGSGTGAVAFGAADRGAAVVALDLDVDALRRGRAEARRLGAARLSVQADARAAPFRDASFDASLHRGVLVAVDRPAAVAAGERRILRPGGRVSCSVTLGAEVDLVSGDHGLERVWRGLRETLAGAESPAFTERGLIDLYAGAGFDQVHVERWDRTVALDDGDAVARAFVAGPVLGAPPRVAWERAGIPGGLLDEFLARLVREAERGSPARLVAPEAFLTARR